MISEGIALFTISSVVAGIVWGVRLEGRVNTTTQRQEDIKEFLGDKIKTLDDNIDGRLERIERALNGYMREHGNGH